MAEVGQQAVGNVDGGGGDADKRLAEGHARLGFFQCGDAEAWPRFGQLHSALQVGKT